jgi:hypothetical protein
MSVDLPSHPLIHPQLLLFGQDEVESAPQCADHVFAPSSLRVALAAWPAAWLSQV